MGYTDCTGHQESLNATCCDFVDIKSGFLTVSPTTFKGKKKKKTQNVAHLFFFLVSPFSLSWHFK